jgi:hypothetical protein
MVQRYFVHTYEYDVNVECFSVVESKRSMGSKKRKVRDKGRILILTEAADTELTVTVIRTIPFRKGNGYSELSVEI